MGKLFVFLVIVFFAGFAGVMVRIADVEYEVVLSEEKDERVLQALVVEMVPDPAEDTVPVVSSSFVSDEAFFEDDAVEVFEEIPPDEDLLLAVSRDLIEQGDTLVITVESSLDQPVVLVGGVPVKMVQLGTVWYGIWGVHVTAGLGVLTVRSGDVEEIVMVRVRDFPVTELVLSDAQQDQGETPASAVSNVVSDTERLRAVLVEAGTEIYFDGPFVAPLSGELVNVGGVGNIRKSGSSAIRHLGVDLDGRRGDPVYAAQRGVVRMAEYLDNFGNTVIVDHGASIFSLYLHLDSVRVGVGDEVSTGQQVGAVGNTGAYSLDPHLHFSIKIGPASVDPLRFLEAMEMLGE
jgi:murein DD-endopeptidase MepM/ murein hydrolase activator NlpD